MKRSFALVPVLASLLAASALSAVPASAAGSPCGPAQVRTLASSSVARIYVVGRTVYGCSVHGAKAYAIGREGFCNGVGCVEGPQVAGELVGYGLESCGIDTCSAQVEVRRLTDGARLRSFAAVTRPLGAESFLSVGSLVIKRDGAVAWIGVGHAIGAPHGTTEVLRANAHGQPTLLDAGSAIVVGSMRLHGSTLSWKHGTRTLRASLT